MPSGWTRPCRLDAGGDHPQLMANCFESVPITSGQGSAIGMTDCFCLSFCSNSGEGFSMSSVDQPLFGANDFTVTSLYLNSGFKS